MRLSTIFSTKAGDSFDSIARRTTGIASDAGAIASANPGVSEPIPAGTQIVIPGLALAIAPTVAASDDEVALLVGGKRFRFWGSVRITRAIDAMDTVSFDAPFDAGSADFRAIFRPFSYQSVVVSVGGVVLFTGTMVSVEPRISSTQKTVELSCYSVPGVLNDCTMPASAYPLEFTGQTLAQIATSVALPFSIPVVFSADPGLVFDRVALKPGQKVLPILAKLAKQRNLIISSTPAGALLFQRPTGAAPPVAALSQGSSPLRGVTPFFRPQDYYSHITGIAPIVIGEGGSQITVANSRLLGSLRPITFESADITSAAIKIAVQAKASRMFGGAVAYQVDLSTWRDVAGRLWEPGTQVTVLAPDAMIYTAYVFTIRSVVFERTPDASTATLDLVPPGSFAGVVPEVMPWDG